MVGAIATTTLGWQAIFALNLPLAAVLFALARRAPTAHAAARPVLSPRTQAAAGLASVGLVGAAIELGARLIVPGAVLAVVGLASAAALLRIERRSDAPLLRAVLRRRAVRIPVAASGLYQFGAYGLQFVLTLNLQDDWRLSPMTTGVALAPLALAWSLGNVLSSRSARQHSPPARIATGALLACAGALGLLGLPLIDRWLVLVACTSLVGLGGGLMAPRFRRSCSGRPPLGWPEPCQATSTRLVNLAAPLK